MQISIGAILHRRLVFHEIILLPFKFGITLKKNTHVFCMHSTINMNYIVFIYLVSIKSWYVLY